MSNCLRPLLFMTAAALPLTACTGGPIPVSSGSSVAMASALPPGEAVVSAADFSTYRLGPGDLIIVDVYGAPTLTREGEVDAAGNFAMPLVGTVAAGGRTPTELSALIAASLRGRVVKDPQVTVSIKKAVSQMVTIDGAVREPGMYPVLRRMSLQQAIASAKGVGDLANLDRVMVFRTVGTEKLAALFSLKAIRAGRMPDPPIYANDIVVVGESATQRFLKTINQLPLVGTFGRFIP